ncbi:MAG: hypothetical protein ACYTGG_06220 [Planctomycetota bacterium]
MAFLTSPAASKIGIVLTRVIVPLWVLTGAIFKLVEKTPKLLPREIWVNANEVGINLYWLLATLIALEFLAVGVMLMVARLARLMAILMLGAFCLVLLNEMRVGNTTCGCLGAVTPPVWLMLAVDGALLLGVLLFRPRYEPGPALPKAELIAAAVWILSGFAVSAAVVLPEQGRSATGTVGPGTQELPAGGNVGGGPPTPPPSLDEPGQQPPAYYIPKATEWVGQPWRSIDLAHYMKAWPADLDTGRRYIIFYSRTCDHCMELLENYFFDPPPAPTLLVAIPERKDGFDTGAELEMIYCRECVEHAELPIGSEWIITSPIVVALEDGIVTCAQEGGYDTPPEDCLIWHSAAVSE